MKPEDRVKRRLLQGVLEENLEVRDGQPRGTIRRERAARSARWRRLLRSAGVAAVVVVTGLLLATMRNGGGASPTATAAPVPSTSAIEPEGSLLEQFANAVIGGRDAGLVGDVIPLEVSTVVVDPGHGGVDSGTAPGMGLLEKNLTLDIARRLAALLEAGGCRAVLTRNDDRAVSLRERAEIANAARADLFLSIHLNWLPDREARGVETYYLGPTNDPFIRKLAAAENERSGYALADYRSLLEGIFADTRQHQSLRLAEAIQSHLVATIGSAQRKVADRGVMTAPFVVLVATEMPAVLVEVACLSNQGEAHQVASPEYRQRVAAALVDGIRSYAASIGDHAENGAQG